jgi:hypothetical protein
LLKKEAAMKNFNVEEFDKKLERKRNSVWTKFLGIYSKNIFETSAEILKQSFGLPEEKRSAAASYLGVCHFFKQLCRQQIAEERKLLGEIMPELSVLSDDDITILRDVYQKSLSRHLFFSRT